MQHAHNAKLIIKMSVYRNKLDLGVCCGMNECKMKGNLGTFCCLTEIQLCCTSPLSLSISWQTSLHTAPSSSSFRFSPSRNTENKQNIHAIYLMMHHNSLTLLHDLWMDTHRFQTPPSASPVGFSDTWATHVHQSNREDQEACTPLNFQSKTTTEYVRADIFLLVRKEHSL